MRLLALGLVFTLGTAQPLGLPISGWLTVPRSIPLAQTVVMVCPAADAQCEGQPVARQKPRGGDNRGYYAVVGLAPGKYVVWAFQDKDGNGKLERAAEPYAPHGLLDQTTGKLERIPYEVEPPAFGVNLSLDLEGF
ncbi:MAG: hypothetical protein SFU83_13365 [Meiothermus sp.]|nr:hypothetical protein [Meiothermus sp.]